MENYSQDTVIVRKNNAVSKNVLDDENYCWRTVDFSSISPSQLCRVTERRMVFFRINGITQFWKEKCDINAIMSDLLCGLDRDRLGYAYIIRGDFEGIRVNIGIDESYADSLKSSLIS